MFWICKYTDNMLLTEVGNNRVILTCLFSLKFKFSFQMADLQFCIW